MEVQDSPEAAAGDDLTLMAKAPTPRAADECGGGGGGGGAYNQELELITNFDRDQFVQVIQPCLEAIVKAEMEAAFGPNLWADIAVVKPDLVDGPPFWPKVSDIFK